MPNLKISQFTALATSAQSPNYLLPLADSGVTNYAMTLNSIFSNIAANTTTGQVTSTTVSTALSATNLGIVVTRGDNRRTIQARINTDVLPAPQLLISSIVGPLEGDNINRITFQKGDNGGTQAPSTSTLGTVEFSNTTAVCASWEARSLQSSGGNGTVQTWYSTRRNALSVAGIFGIDNWGTFRVSRNLGPLYSDVQLSDPSKLMVIGNVDALNDTSNVCLHVLNATTFTNQLNLLLQAVAGQSTNLFECKTSANVKTLQITTAGVLSPGSAAGVDLATSALPFKDLYLAGSSGTPGTNNFRLTGTATAARVITLPDATCTLSASSSALTSGRVVFTTTGGLLADSANFTYTTASGPNLLIQAANAAHIACAVKGAAAQTANLQEWQNSGGTILSSVSASGGIFAASLNANLAASSSWLIGADRTDTAAGTTYVMHTRAHATITANQSTQQISYYALQTDQAISAGVTDSGYRRGFQFDTFTNNAGFAGTLAAQTAMFVNMGIFTAASTGAITTVTGLNIDGYNSTSGATIGTMYGVRVNTSASTTGTVTTRYDFYGASATAKNYLAGFLSVGVDASTAQFQVNTGAKARVAAIIKGAASQTANLQEWQDSAATVLSGIDASGRFYAPAALTATTVGAAGGASELPLTPTGYLLINVNGTQKKVPYYDN